MPWRDAGSGAGALLSFNPYEGDRSGVTVSAGFVDFASGRFSIVTAAGPGGPGRVKVFNYSLMTPVNAAAQPSAALQPAVTASFAPFGDTYRGGLSLATGWLAASLGGAERIVVGQLGEGSTVKVYSSGSEMRGGPQMYLHSMMHDHPASFSEVARFDPFDGKAGVSVATTSTTAGADLLVAGMMAADKTARVLKYHLSRPNAQATMLTAEKINEVISTQAPTPPTLGGD